MKVRQTKMEVKFIEAINGESLEIYINEWIESMRGKIHVTGIHYACNAVFDPTRMCGDGISRKYSVLIEYLKENGR
jgi:hypothetical protein